MLTMPDRVRKIKGRKKQEEEPILVGVFQYTFQMKAPELVLFQINPLPQGLFQIKPLIIKFHVAQDDLKHTIKLRMTLIY